MEHGMLELNLGEFTVAKCISRTYGVVLYVN
jgi:hypothetical protein